MNSEIFRKAWLLKDTVKLNFKGQNKEFYEVGNTSKHQVILSMHDKVIDHFCDCDYMSKKSSYLLCSHKLAVLLYKCEQEGQEWLR